MQVNYPPGPKDSVLGLTHLVRLLSNPLGFLSEVCRLYGRLAYVKLFNSHLYFVSDHDLIHQLFSGRTHHCERLWLEKHAFAELLGNGLAVSEGALWQKQRRFLQPAFHHHRVNEHIPIIMRLLSQLMTEWGLRATRDLEVDLMRLTLEINIDIIFGEIQPNDTREIQSAIAETKALWTRRAVSEVLFPHWVPTLAKYQMTRTVQKLDNVIMKVIQDKRCKPYPDSSLMETLIHTPFDDGTSISDKQLRDEVVNLLLSGRKTTSISLIWALYLLAKHPEVAAKVYNEVNTILGRREPTEIDLSQFRYTDMVIKETLRLYPPLFVLIRQPKEPMRLDEYNISAKNTYLLISPYHLHRDSRYYDNPDSFIPERFSPDKASKIPPYAYVPFGTGLHVCIGKHLALLTIKLALIIIFQHYDFKITPTHDVPPYPFGVLRPKHKLYLVARPRASLAGKT